MGAPVNQAAAFRMTRARSAVVMNPDTAFFGALLMGMEFVERTDIDTMATDGRAIYYAPAFVLANTEPENIGTLIHEVEHCARGHHVRRGNRDLLIWNEACDYVINPDLMAAGYVLPPGVLFAREHAGKSAEQVYTALAPKAPEPEPERKPEPGDKGPDGAAGGPGQSGKPDDAGKPAVGPGKPGAGPGDGPGKPGKGDGAGGPPAGPGAGGDPVKGAPDPGRCGGILDAAPDAAGIQEAAAEWQVRVRQAAMVAKAAGAGKLPGYVAEILDELDKAAGAVDWRAEVRRFAADSSQRDTSWTRPNRRFAYAGVILPGSVAVNPAHIVFAVDTSASMDRRALAMAAAEMQSLLDDGAADRVTVIACDVRVNSAVTYEAGDTVHAEFRGRGGTKFSPAFEWIAEHAPEASGIVYLTDLDSRDFGPEPTAPVLWLRTPGTPRTAPWGDVIPLDPHA